MYYNMIHACMYMFMHCNSRELYQRGVRMKALSTCTPVIKHSTFPILLYVQYIHQYLGSVVSCVILDYVIP